MTSITDVPYEDIKLFLTKNNVRISSNEKSNYGEVLKMIKAGKGTDHPDSLIDWIIAYNLLNDKIHVNRYSVTEINFANEKELNELAESLGVFDSANERQSVLNVLRYLKKLDSGIVNKDIDSYIFSLGQTIDEQKILTSGYSEIIKIFQKNKILRNFIYYNMEKIIKGNTFEDVDLTEDLLSNSALSEMVDFIVDLLKMEELALATEAFKIFFRLVGNDHDDKIDLSAKLYYSVIYSKDANLIEQYFRLLSILRELFSDDEQYSDYDDDTFLDLFEDEITFDSAQEYHDYIVPFLTASIRTKNKRFIDYVDNVWEGERHYYINPEDQWFVKKMDELIRQGKSVK